LKLETRLSQAKERRQKLDKNRESLLNIRNEKALQRAKENLQSKQDKLRNMFSKVTEVKRRHTKLE